MNKIDNDQPPALAMPCRPEGRLTLRQFLRLVRDNTLATDSAVIAEGAHFIRVMCLAWGAIGVQLCIVSAFRASGNLLVAMVIAIISQFMIQFPLAYVLSGHTGLHATGLWLSFPIANIASALVSACWFAQGGWKKTRLTQEDQEVAKVTEETIAEEGIR